MRHVRIRFSAVEKVDLLKAWVAISLAFAVFFLVERSGGITEVTFVEFVISTLFAAVTAGIGFLGHELCHKFAASRFGVHSEFRSDDKMLVISLLIAFFGLIFAAPGAVYMTSAVSRRENGIISAAGPLANMVLALCFLPLALLEGSLLALVGSYGLWINALLGVFNLIPFGFFDGVKVLHWSKAVYFAMLASGAVLIVVAYGLV